jgi:hypothetical protein
MLTKKHRETIRGREGAQLTLRLIEVQDRNGRPARKRLVVGTAVPIDGVAQY